MSKSTICLSEKEVRYLGTIESVVVGRISAREAAERLGVSVRTIFRLKKKVSKGGSFEMVHRSRGRPAHNRVSKEERKKIEDLLRERYFDFTPTHAAEKLSELHGIKRDRKTISTIMKEMGLLVRKRKRHSSIIHRAWREPKARLGELVQFDGSYHAWLQDRFTDRHGNHEICLLAAIDDATGTLLHASFDASEGVLPVMRFWKEYAQKQGFPKAIYLDRFSTYKMNLSVAAENPDTKTQFSRAMKDLGVELIFAHSPQGKGRVERLFQTLQDRLLKELRLANIHSKEEANVFLSNTFLPDFNKRFARTPHQEGDLHRTLTEKEQSELDLFLSRQDVRTLRNDFTISHTTNIYQLLPTPRLLLRPKDTVHVYTYPDETIHLFVRGKMPNFTLLSKGSLKPFSNHPSDHHQKII